MHTLMGITLEGRISGELAFFSSFSMMPVVLLLIACLPCLFIWPEEKQIYSVFNKALRFLNRLSHLVGFISQIPFSLLSNLQFILRTSRNTYIIIVAFHVKKQREPDKHLTGRKKNPENMTHKPLMCIFHISTEKNSNKTSNYLGSPNSFILDSGIPLKTMLLLNLLITIYQFEAESIPKRTGRFIPNHSQQHIEYMKNGWMYSYVVFPKTVGPIHCKKHCLKNLIEFLMQEYVFFFISFHGSTNLPTLIFKNLNFSPIYAKTSKHIFCRSVATQKNSTRPFKIKLCMNEFCLFSCNFCFKSFPLIFITACSSLPLLVEISSFPPIPESHLPLSLASKLLLTIVVGMIFSSMINCLIDCLLVIFIHDVAWIQTINLLVLFIPLSLSHAFLSEPPSQTILAEISLAFISLSQNRSPKKSKFHNPSGPTPLNLSRWEGKYEVDVRRLGGNPGVYCIRACSVRQIWNASSRVCFSRGPPAK
ncbi:hypothetical protein VP01_2726g1 [Puccinia sorghi]|uniref:Uncharacterized protein n=1 Tax=Puccinia sorghi TaxID=27349 RepID=A0A0L6V401_9BASI|nr:hypothetical protein VP01_2726g1 [Puccinia sorghi]